ncbi:MAG: MFS transporter [Chitinophagia bacterium]|jgi:DHA3 family macrolide efflux protein-like MFS transporter|nr:MFS transporter [Chitinophagia bacterium]
MSMIAIPWYFAQNEKLAFFGIVYLVTNFLSMFWMPFSGSIVDKYNRKKIFLVLNIVVGAILLLISLVGYARGALPPVMVASVFVLTFLNYNIHYPCLYAFVQEIIEAKSYYKITSLLEIVGQITTIMAGAGATLLLEGTSNGSLNILGFKWQLGFDIAPWKIYEIFSLDAMTYFISFFIILMIRFTPVVARKIEQGSLISRLKFGLEYLKQNSQVFWFGILSYMVFLAVLLEAFYLGVSYVSNHLEASGDVYANSKIAYSMGAICVGLIIRYVFRYINIPFGIIVMTFFAGAIFLTLSLTHSIYLFFALMMFLGICNAGVRIARMTYLFKNVDNQFFGRAGSIFFLTNVVFRIILLFIFSIAFFQTDNHIVYAYMIVGGLLFLSSWFLVKHYYSFDRSLSDG